MLKINYNYNKDAKARNAILRRFSLFDGTGNDLRNCNDYNSALDAAGLNFDVIQTNVAIADGNYSGNILKNRKVNLRADTGEDLGLVTNRYNPIQHKNAFSICEEIHKEGIANFEIGGVGRGSKNSLNSSTGFMVMRHPDFDIKNEQHQAFSFFRNTFDGSGGLLIKFVVLRLLCLNGLARQYKTGLGTITIRHTESSSEKIEIAKKIMIKHEKYIRTMQNEADVLSKTPFSKAEFQKEILPLILKIKGIKENKAEDEWERKRGAERIEELIQTVITTYNSEDTQNYNNTAYKVMLTLSDLDSHMQNLRNTLNPQVYMNRVLQLGVTQNLLNPIMDYIYQTRGINLKLN